MAVEQVAGVDRRRQARYSPSVLSLVALALTLVLGLGGYEEVAHSSPPDHPPLPRPVQLPAGYYAQSPVFDAQGHQVPGRWVGYDGLDDSTCFALTWQPSSLLLRPFTAGTWTRQPLTAPQCHTLIEGAAPARK